MQRGGYERRMDTAQSASVDTILMGALVANVRGASCLLAVYFRDSSRSPAHMDNNKSTVRCFGQAHVDEMRGDDTLIQGHECVLLSVSVTTHSGCVERH